MAWQAIDRNRPAMPEGAPPVLSEAVKEKIRAFFDRYPTRQAALLPALHIAQEAAGCVSLQVMKEVAELLGLAPSQVMDTASFYTHFWPHARGRKVIVLCRSLSCELMGGRVVADAVRRELGIDEHETTPDGQYSFITEECLGACEHGPCMLINERLHPRLTAEQIPAILKDPGNDRLDIARSSLYDPPDDRGRTEQASAGGTENG
ncbi:MAG: NAD(P)H-dependent oxidoreductase subunit E [Phycisphaerae bacterium]|nr:NAD(P)H-dependent oxidoreductase subunit E [Phycisphaerae bacterium]